MFTNRKCPVCGDTIKGRADKKYCSLKCKSINQYEKRQTEERFYLQIEKQLRTNRRVLKHYNKSGFTTLRKTELLKAGFNPRYFTHQWKNHKNEVYHFVYEFGFLEKTINGKEKFVLVIWQDYMNSLV